MNRPTLTVLGAALAGLILGAVSRTLEAQRSGTPPPQATGASSSDSTRFSPSEEASPVAAALSAFHGDMDLDDLARLGEVLTRLSPDQFSELLDHLERTSAGSTDNRLAWIFTWWQRREPEAAFAWVKPRLLMVAQDGPLEFTFGMNARAKLIFSWAAEDPRRAIEFARQHPGSGLAAHLLQTALDASADRDDSASLAFLLEFPARTRKIAMEALMRSWGTKDGPAALAAADSLPEADEREACAAYVLETWSEKDPGAAFEHFRLRDGRDTKALPHLLYNGAKGEPEALAEWVQTLDGAEFERWAPKLVETWVRNNPIAALEFAYRNDINLGTRYGLTRTQFMHDSLRRPGRSSTESGAQPLAIALRERPKETLAWIQGLPPGPDRDSIMELAARDASSTEALAIFPSLPPDAAARTARSIALRFDTPEEARIWAESLPQGKARENAWAGVGSKAEHLFDLPRGADRDAMLSGLTFSSTGLNDPVFALDHSLMIDDPILREDTFENVMQIASEHQPTKASQVKQWLEDANIPETWKARWRSSLHQTKQ